MSARVDVWCIDIAAAACGERRLRRLLDDVERARAAELVRPADARAFRLAHGALRVILSERLDVAPHEVRYTRGRYGKPALAAGGPAFSLSHGGGVTIVAVAASEVGADVERVRSVRDARSLARRYLAPGPSLEHLDDEGFMRSWTALEAVRKAVGTGIADDQERLELHVLARDRARLWRAGRKYEPGWTVRWVAPAPRYVAAIAMGGDDDVELTVRQFAWASVRRAPAPSLRLLPARIAR